MSNGRAIAEHEIQRILALVPWLVANPGSLRTDVAQRFGISSEQLDQDLDLMLMVGVPPYTPGDYIDVDDDGETITLRMADSFRRPPQLTGPEGLAVLAAGRALLAVPGSDPDGPLASALAKLADALGNPNIAVSIDEPPHLAIAREAVEERRELQITYWTASRDAQTNRVVQPNAVFFAEGAWYLDAWCRRADDDRLFRVDRIRAAQLTPTKFPSNDDWVQRETLYQPRANDPQVSLDVTADARWVGEQYPAESIEDMAQGGQRITLRVSEVAFLERLVLRLGPSASVVKGTGPTDFSAQQSALRVLARYGATTGHNTMPKPH